MRRTPLVLVMVASLAAANAAEPVYHAPPGVEPGRLPFSEAVRVGDMLYLSGMLGTRAGTTELVDGGIVAETRATLENIRAVLERHGSGMDRVVKCTVFLADISDWARMTEEYVKHFPAGRRPARTAVGSGGLPLGARVEIECIATP